MDRQAEQPPMLRILNEQDQAHETRAQHFVELEKELGRPVGSYFTSFRFPVSIEDSNAELLEGILQGLDLSQGLALFISSPGGDSLASQVLGVETQATIEVGGLDGDVAEPAAP